MARRLALCCFDELRVLDIELGRLEKGRHDYGHLDLSMARDWDREEAEELLDARLYRAMGKLVQRDEAVQAIERENTTVFDVGGES